MSIEKEVDKLGRVVLPINYRKRLNITENAVVNVKLENNSIIITPASTFCVLCEKATDLHSEKALCFSCIKEIKELN